MTEAAPRLLIVEDDLGLRRQLEWCFDDYEVLVAATRSEAIAHLRRFEPPVVLQDLGLPPDPQGVSEGLATLSEILVTAPRTKVIVITGNVDRDSAVKAVSLGAYDFYQKPIDNDVLALIVQRALALFRLEEENRQLQQRASAPLAGVIATSDSMLRACRMIEKVAPTNATTLLLGESGTGKELLARAVHSLSARASGPFMPINCAAIPETLLESELFGFEKGAFTGANRQSPGKIELASGGTLFLDEIGDMPLALQGKLLRFLQDRVIERIGGRERIPVDVRVVSATNRDVEGMITSGEFRQDLYYRISEVTVRIPPLRERPGDSAVIARQLLEVSARRHGRPVIGLTPDALAAIQAYSWPGNIRELENRINAAVIMAEGKRVTAADLGLAPAGEAADFLNLRSVRARAEQQAIRAALAVCGGNLSRAAEMLGITRPTLYDLIEKNDIHIGSDRQGRP